MAPPSEIPSGTSSPRSFATQTASAEDLLKSQTIGLVNLSDFRKRRAEVLEQKEKEAQDRSYSRFKLSRSGSTTPAVDNASDDALTPQNGPLELPPKKKKKKAAKGLLSFRDDEEDFTSGASTPAPTTPQDLEEESPDASSSKADKLALPRRLTPNPNAVLPAPKVMTKAALQAEAVARDNLRREFLALQEAVKATEILIPFVFYDGTNIPGGTVKVKKGDHVWLFLDRCRKVGAELGVAGGGAGGNSNSGKSKNDSRREWARVGVDDLMLVRGELIIPHHYEFYYFIANRVPSISKSGGLLFDYSNTAPQHTSSEDTGFLRTANTNLEGKDHDPAMTKVVDRRWYERNKHIFPATLWKEYEAGADFTEKMSKMRRDAEGNAFFFS